MADKKKGKVLRVSGLCKEFETTGEGALVAGELGTVPSLRSCLTFDRPLTPWAARHVSSIPTPIYLPNCLMDKASVSQLVHLEIWGFRGSPCMS